MTEQERAEFFIRLICWMPSEDHIWDECGADLSGTEAADELYEILDAL